MHRDKYIQSTNILSNDNTTVHAVVHINVFYVTLNTVCPNKKETRLPVICIFIATHVLITLYASLSRVFYLLSFDTKHMMISQCMTETEQVKLMHVKIDLRRIMVLS